MKYISNSFNSPNLTNADKPLQKDIIINEKIKLKTDASIVCTNGYSRLFDNTSRILGYTIEYSDWLCKHISGDLPKSVVSQLRGRVLLPLNDVVRASSYFLKISTSRNINKKLNKIKSDFSDLSLVHLKNGKKRSKTLKELQKERESLLCEISNIESEKIKKSFEIKRRTLSKPSSFFKNIKFTEKPSLTDEELSKLDEELKQKKSKLNRLSEYSLIAELETSNKTKILENSILLVHSLVTFAINSTVFVLSTLATITVNPFIAISSDILWWNNKLLLCSGIGKKIFEYAKSSYLGDIKIKRAYILLKKIDNLQKTVLLSYQKLGEKSLKQSAIVSLNEHFDLSDEIKDILSNIGKTFITANQVNTLRTFLNEIYNSSNFNYDDTINSLLVDLNARLLNYEKNITPLITSMLGDEPISAGEFSSLRCFGIPEDDVYAILKQGVGKRFITLKEVDVLKAYFKRIQTELKLSEKSESLSLSDLKNINNLIARFNEQFSCYEETFIYGNIDVAKVIKNSAALSTYLLMLEAKSDSVIISISKKNWIDRLSQGNFRSSYSNYLSKTFDYIEKNFYSSQSVKNDLFTVEDNEWGKVWKLFHPYRTTDTEERYKRDNGKFLLDLIRTTDVSFVRHDNESIDRKTPKEIHKMYEQYLQCEHVCDYINALAAVKSNSRKKLLLSLNEHIHEQRDLCMNDALEIIQYQLKCTDI